MYCIILLRINECLLFFIKINFAQFIQNRELFFNKTTEFLSGSRDVLLVSHVGDSLEGLDVSRVVSRSRSRLIITAGRELGT